MKKDNLFKSNKEYNSISELIKDLLETTGQSPYSIVGYQHAMRLYRAKSNSGQRIDCRTLASLYDLIDYQTLSRTIKNHAKNFVRNSKGQE